MMLRLGVATAQTVEFLGMATSPALRSFAWRPRQEKIKNWKIVKGDQVSYSVIVMLKFFSATQYSSKLVFCFYQVEVITGRYRKSQGKVLKVYRKKNQVLVENVNMKFKQVEDDEGVTRKKTVQQEHPIHVSNVALIDPDLNVPTRIRIGYLEDGTKVRVSKKSGAIVPKPDRSNLTYAMRNKDYKSGPNDTTPD